MIAVLTTFSFLLLCLAFIVTENAFRRHGNTPGLLFNNIIRVDSIIDYGCVKADSDGLQRLYRPYRNIENFSPINRTGFLSRFDYTPRIIDSIRNSGKKIIMSIGDSFTQGLSSSKADSAAFTALLNDEDYVALNFGVLGTDPLQYRLIVNRYLDSIKPDIVIINLCMENDRMYYNRKPKPCVPLHYYTNAGVLYNNKPMFLGEKPDETFNNAAECYHYQRTMYDITYNHKGLLPLLGKLCITTQLYRLYFYIKLIVTSYYIKAETDYSLQHLNAIKDACATRKLHLIFAALPTVNGGDTRGSFVQHIYEPKDTAMLEMHVKLPAGITEADYLKGDIHFNDAGHRKYAAFLKQLIANSQFSF